MKKYRKHFRKFASIPQTPKSEIVSSPFLTSVEMTVPKQAQIPERSTFTAPIRLPSREKLAVDMVPSNLVYLYDEYRSEESKTGAWLFTFIGAFLGVIINWATSEPLIITKSSVVIELILLVTIIFSGSLAHGFNRRAKAAKSQIDNLAKK